MPGGIPNSAYRLRWRRTWPDQPDDFAARLGDEGFCRVYLFTGGAAQAGKWYWVANRGTCLGSGFAEMPREAALAAERTLFLSVSEAEPRPSG